MTFGHGCNDDCVSETKIDYLPYKKDGDDIWSNHLGHLIDYQVKNLGKNGVSNDYIFDTIIENFDKIQENDIVIINTTLYGRIEVPIGDSLCNVLSSYEGAKKIMKDYINEEEREKIESVINFQYHFSNHQFYKQRHKNRFQFLKNRVMNDKNHTNGKVNDTHFSYNGHLDFAHYLFSLMDNKKLI